MYHPKRFGTEEEARETIAKEYTNRNKMTDTMTIGITENK
jgi:hypothetical protein